MRYLFFCFKLALIVFAFFKVGDFCDQKTDKFRVGRIYSSLKYNTKWEIPALPSSEIKNVQDVLKQRFTYLASGGQCYVFASEDGKSVIKFFKHHRRSLPFWIRALPLPSPIAKKRDKRQAKKSGKLVRDFNSYKLSYDHLQEQTGVFYIHLNKTHDLNTKLTILDKLNIAHTINLDDIEFVLQKRAELVHPYIEKALSQKDTPRAQRAIRSLIHLIIARSQKGIYDEDARIHRNFGFLDEKPLIIDVGRLVADETRKNPTVYKHDIHKIVSRFKMWLEDTHPELTPTLDQELEKIYEKN